MEENPKQSDIASSETYYKNLAVTNRDLELISKALGNMVDITTKVAEDNTFSSPVRYTIQDVCGEYLKLKGRIDLI